ncbi:aromatic ring-hydroxylating oxygenase subunit alpha [Paraburkholderia xenovorans]
MSTAKEKIIRLQPEFDKTRQKLSVARHLPGAVYSSADIYALEKEKIFMTHWLSVARVEEVANVGDYMTFSVMGESIVIARPSTDEIVVYMNQCLHRGVEVASGCGNLEEFSCPYHAWLYGIDGKLISAPGMKACDVDLSQASLRRVKSHVWRGWVFVNFAEEPVPFEEFIEPYERSLWWFRTDECKLADRVVIDVRCNWKFLTENLIDIYHVGVIHRNTFGGFVKGEQLKFHLEKDGGWHTSYEARPHSKSGEQVFPTLPWATDKPSGIACKAGIYPNLNLSMRSDSIRAWHVWPVTPDTTRIICYLMFPPEAFDIPNYEQELAKYREFVRQIIAEDAVMVESLQNSAGSKFFTPGPMSPLEEALYHMENHYLELMSA